MMSNLLATWNRRIQPEENSGAGEECSRWSEGIKGMTGEIVREIN